MNSTDTYDFCVLGAGLAGLAVCNQLLQTGATVALIDINDIASGASGTPLGLVNPATGRFGTKAWNAEVCFTAVADDLKKVQAHSTSSFYKNTGILRPAQDEKMAARMKENSEIQNWPEGWCQWIDKDELLSINPDLHCIDGGLWLPKGLTVNVNEYLKAKASYLETQGLTVITNASYEIFRDDRTYRLALADNQSLQSESLIFTAGYDLHRSKYWDFLPLNPVKGQVAVFETPLASNFDYSISALGYMASISNTRFVAGSTYEHHFEDREPDEEGLEYLKNRLGKVYPKLFEKATLVEQWAGVRASTPNRKPIVGVHPTQRNMYVYTGMGSKGMLYSEYVASLLIAHINDQEPLPTELSIDRI